MKPFLHLLHLALLTAMPLIVPAQAHAAPANRIVFPRAFAPSEGWVKPPEMPLRQEECLNGSWRFQPVPVPTGWEKAALNVPSPWNANAFNQGDGGDFRCYPSYPKRWDAVEMGWLERSFRVPAAWRGRHLVLRFEAVAGDAVVSVNGKAVAHNFDLFLPFEADVTQAVTFSGSNVVRVGVRKASLFNDTRTTGSRPGRPAAEARLEPLRRQGRAGDGRVAVRGASDVQRPGIPGADADVGG